LTLSTPKNPVTLTLGRLLVAWFILLCLPKESLAQRQDTTRTSQDTTKNQPYQPSKRPTFRPNDRYGDPFSNRDTESPLFLKDPNQMKLDVEIDTAMNYTIYEKIGDLNYRPTSSMTFQEFKQHQDRQILKNYWQGRSKAQDGESPVSGRGLIPKIFISPVLDRIFGGSYVELVPRGFVTLDFGGSFQKINNPALPIRQQRNGGFEFEQQINMSVVGKVGEKLQVTANFDNNNSFDFQNNMKVEYTGFKEDILQKLEIGNVSLPLNNTLIQGAQNLFGIKAKLQFGKLDVTAIATTQRGKTSSIDVGGSGPGGGGQGRPFEIIASNYDDNRHFFLGQFFRDNYEEWLSGLPQIYSGVIINRVEVYVLNRTTDTQTLRNVVGLMDLGEGDRVYNPNVQGRVPGSPTNNAANDLQSLLLYSPAQRNPDGINNALETGPYAMQNGLDFEKITGARKLNPSEFTFHPQLGYLTLSRKLQNDEALAVAFEYLHNGTRYVVGELSDDYGKYKDEDVVFLKLLRPRKVSVRDAAKVIIPTWDLMMKNIYNLNVTQLEREGFQLRIIYRDDRSGIDNPQLQEGDAVRRRQLIEIFGLDRLNPVNDPGRDGNFDFVEGSTIHTSTGQIVFPYLHPFSGALQKAFENEAQRTYLTNKYVFDELYTTTKADAELLATKNKFWLKGNYNAGSAKEILIPGFGVSQGSVKLFAGGIPLMEGTDYTVDYTFGKVTILNESILSSGKNIEVQFEQSDPFAFQTRSLLGTRFDYHLNEDVNLGSTFLYYNERPIISRNQIGTEPARNIQYGFDFNVNKKSRLLTKIVDAIPILQTKEQSTINFTGEFAQLLPGTSNVIDGEGTAYIDDFENSATPYSLMNPVSWKLSSIPKDPRFDETKGALNVRDAGYKRAKIAWYQIDNQFYRENGGYRPDYINDDDLNNHYIRAVGPQEIFPLKQLPPGTFWENIFDVAYYPEIRGPYNYTTGFPSTPVALRENWGAITTAIRTEVDFDKANIEYVEFWLMDPFLPGPNGKVLTQQRNGLNNDSGGQLIFQLGSISEDVARDGKHAFENGLPTDGEESKTIKNAWGYVTTQQYLTNAFDNSGASRSLQDVGFDGVSGEKEKELSDYKGEDASSDNFRYFLDGSYDDVQAQILERYRDINGQDGNSPIITGSDDVTPAGTNIPDNEDLNADNTLSELEEYYEYSIDLRPGGLDIGREYIVDKISPVHEKTGEPVTWYLFRIPIRQVEKTFGNIEGFKSIKYMRMLLTGYDKPVVLRMANFRMVGSRWRRYSGTLLEGGLTESPENAADNFTVSVVNLEENKAGSDKKSPYFIPPGVVRDRDQTAANSRMLNEQSVQVCIDDLDDGDARAIYKNVSVDLFNYGHVKMFFHANSEETQDDELAAFLRMGTDFDQNYYEIEIPLKITRPANPAGVTDRDVWPEENEIDLDLSALYALKGLRDREKFPLDEVFRGSAPVGRHSLSILGRPDLTSVQVIMIGVRNKSSDDRRSHSLCLWANELRVTDFNRTAGWAVNSTLSAKLADFATVNGAIRYTSFGFGGVSSKIFERTREETTAYDISSNVNIDKLIPGNTGIKIPMFVSYQRSVRTPLYDPANPDLKLTDALKSFDEGQRDDYLEIVKTQETVRSLNFVNVRKVKVNPDAKTHLWDIENLSFSYSYSDRLMTSFTSAQEFQKQHRGSVAYTFSPKNTGIEPFKDSDKFKSPWLKFIKDFNFNLMPNNISVRADLERSFAKNVYRNSLGNGEFINSEPNYQKMFTFNRTYNLRWSLSKNLTLEYSARANAIIDEPEGELNTPEKRDSIITNLKRFGRMKNFDQGFTINYTLPLDKFPVTDWLGADYRFNVGYNWKAGPVNFDDALNRQDDLPDKFDFKNTIQNNREQNFTGKVDMVKLYNKVKFLKELNTPKKQTPSRTTNPAQRTPTRPAPKADTTKTEQKSMPGIAKSFFRLLMSLRSVNGTYTISEGTILPGFIPKPSLFGMDSDWEAPGFAFVFGSQNPDIRFKAAKNDWLVRNPDLTFPFTQTKNEIINIRANIEPSSDFKVQLDFKKERSASYQEIFRFDNGDYTSQNPTRSGSYRISILAIGTTFNSSNDKIASEVFESFEENLAITQRRLDAANPDGTNEYDSATQDVLIPAFIAAYTGKSANSVSLSPFPKTPAPNWRIDYTGLNKISFFNNIFQSITLSNAYQATYSVVNYSNSLEAELGADYMELDRPIEDYNSTYFGKVIDGVITPGYVISQVMISEQFSPLIGINVRTKGRLTANFQYKTKRDVALNISNAQVTELNSKDVSFELGYTKNNMRLPIKSQGRTVVLKNDVTFRLNTTVSDSKTIQRKIEEDNIITNGNINIQLRPNISYVVNQKLNIQVYFERTINEPLVSNSYRRATTRFGTQIRFSLAQ
jgi:cell surface protein SprA